MAGDAARGSYLSSLLTCKVGEDDFKEKTNPAHPRVKRRTLRQLAAAERLEILKLATAKAMTMAEVAVRFNVKVQLVRDLCKRLGKRSSPIVRKKKAEQKSKQ